MNEQQPPGAPVLEARDLTVIYGARRVLDVPVFEVLPNTVTAVIGPNGSGKTTLVLCLALLLKPSSGSVSYQGHPVGEREKLGLRRRFAVVFQDPLLLDTSAWDNVTLGLRLRRFPKSETKARAEKWLDRFGVATLAKRRARTLSGGEAKRVSLARAFALQPEVLFLDEPFTALDIPTRQGLMEDFESVLRETRVTTVMVTHDRNEALAVGQRVAVLMNGSIRQTGSPQEVFSYPADEEVANFVGAGNVIDGVVSSQSGGLATVNAGKQQLFVASDLPPGSAVALFLRHEDVTLSLPSPEMPLSSARNHLAGSVVRTFPLGSQVAVTVDCGFPLVALVTRRSVEEMDLRAGRRVYAAFKATAVHVIRK